jgi:signal transduction histidine kinase
VVLAPDAKTGFEVLLALGQLFGALVLLFFPDEPARPRLRWVAAGLLVLGFGAFGFGYLLPLWDKSYDLNAALYGSLLVRSLGVGLLAVGLWPERAPDLPARATPVLLAALALVGIGVGFGAERLPRLTEVTDLEAAATGSRSTLEGLTGWHWMLSLVPLAFGIVAAVGAVRHFPGRALGNWLVVATALLAGAQLHTMFWPSAYSPILTTASLLRLGFTLIVAVGGIFELQRVAAERAALLAAARQSARQLTDLAVLRADFTAMVAHELGAPIAAIRRSTELLALEPLGEVQRRAVAAIETEIGVLHALVGDVMASSRIERDDFAIRPRPVPVAALLANAAGFARTLPGDHPLTVVGDGQEQVLADPGRIGQALRNLLANAAKHTPPGTPIELRAARNGDLVRIEVADRGPGIPAEDMSRIFEKYGRGRDAAGRAVDGVGLGLYLSRRIVRAHGGELTVESTPGHGAIFGFDLEMAG